MNFIVMQDVGGGKVAGHRSRSHEQHHAPCEGSYTWHQVLSFLVHVARWSDSQVRALLKVYLSQEDAFYLIS
jgi:hypothetical protein